MQILFLITLLITISLARLQFSVYCCCSNTLFSLSCTHSLLTNAETLLPQATLCFACSNKIFRSVWDPTDRCKSTADVVNNVENPSTFIFSFVILAISNQSFRTIICVAVEKLNKTYAHVTGSSSHLTQSWQPLLAGLLSGDYRCSTKKVCTGYK